MYSKNLKNFIQKELENLKTVGKFKIEKEIAGLQGPKVTIDGRDYLMFASNNYLGHSNHPEILKAAEVYTLNKNLAYIFMKVISVRKELIDWYKRHGYTETGEIIDFMEDNITGKHLEQLQFIVLEKRLK